MRESNSLTNWIKKYPYPRRRFIRGLLRSGIAMAAAVLTRYEVIGKENLPKKGPLLIVGNHFHLLDTIGPIHATKYLLEFIGDIDMPNAPNTMKFLPAAWSTLKIEQGTPNFDALRASEAILAQDGVLAIYPEGHIHPPPLARALPGAAYLALHVSAPIIPIATFSDNNYDLFGTIIKKKRRLRIWTKIGPAFGPFKSNNPDRPTREEIREASRTIMTNIARLMPPSFRGDFDVTKQTPETA